MPPARHRVNLLNQKNSPQAKITHSEVTFMLRPRVFAKSGRVFFKNSPFFSPHPCGTFLSEKGKGFPPFLFNLVKIPHTRAEEVLAAACFLVAGDVLNQVGVEAADADCSL